MRLDGKVSASVELVSGVPQGIILGPSLFILYTPERFQIFENYADDTTIYTVLSPLLHPQVMKSLNQDLAATNTGV